MMRSASGTVENPGTNVAAEARPQRRHRRIMLGHARAPHPRKSRRHPELPNRHSRCAPPTPRKDAARCGHTDRRNRKGKDFACIAEDCGHEDDADINAANNILADGLAVIGREGTTSGANTPEIGPTKRQPQPVLPCRRIGKPRPSGRGEVMKPPDLTTLESAMGDLKQAMQPSTPMLEGVRLLESASLGIRDVTDLIEGYLPEAEAALTAALRDRGHDPAAAAGAAADRMLAGLRHLAEASRAYAATLNDPDVDGHAAERQLRAARVAVFSSLSDLLDGAS